MSFPLPPSHRTFTFANVIIDSNFDSGNCSNAEKVSPTNVINFNIKNSIIYGLEQIILKIIIELGFIFLYKELLKAQI